MADVIFLPKDRGKFAMGNALQSKPKLNLCKCQIFLSPIVSPSDFCSKASRGNSILLKQPTESSYLEVIYSFWGPNPSFEFVPTNAAEYFPLHLAGTVRELMHSYVEWYFYITAFVFSNPFGDTYLLALSTWSIFNCLVGLFFQQIYATLVKTEISFSKNFRYPFLFPSTNPCQMQIFWC